MSHLARRAATTALVVAFVIAPACRAPTQLALRLSTDVACSQLEGVSISVGAPGGVETQPASAQTFECAANGSIGSLVVVPGGERDAEIALRVVAAVGSGAEVEACVPPAYQPATGGCIVARRVLRFLPHEPLTLPIALRGKCIGTPCSPSETCVDGFCQDATITDSSVCASEAGCDEGVLWGASAHPGAGGAGGVSGSGGSAGTAGGGGSTSTGTTGGGGSTGTTGGGGSTGTTGAGGGAGGAGPAGSRRVFVTSATYTAGLGGLVGADAKCQALADVAKLGGTYKAWLSDSKASPSTRFTQTGGPFVRVDGKVVAKDWAALLDSAKTPLENPIDVTEKKGSVPSSTVCSALHPAAAWTGTSAKGTESVMGSNSHCSDWTSGAGGETAQLVWSDPSQVDGRWTYDGSCNLAGQLICSRKAALYCFEQ